MFLNMLTTFPVIGKLVDNLCFSILKHRNIRNKDED